MKRIVVILLLLLLAVGLAASPAAAGPHGGGHGGAHGGFHEGGHSEFHHREEIHQRRFGLGFVPYPYYPYYDLALPPAYYPPPSCYVQPGYWATVPYTDAQGYTSYQYQWVPDQTVCQ